VLGILQCAQVQGLASTPQVQVQLSTTQAQPSTGRTPVGRQCTLQVGTEPGKVRQASQCMATTLVGGRYH